MAADRAEQRKRYYAENKWRWQEYRERNREQLREYRRQWRTKNPEKAAVYRERDVRRLERDRERYYARPDDYHGYQLKRDFGMSRAEYAALLEAQKGVCAICGNPERATTPSGRPKRLAVDHCHRTGKVRGLLCQACNFILAHAQDDASRLLSAMSYLCQPRK